MDNTYDFDHKRAMMRDEFFGKLFLLGGWLGGTDTYKRTMWSAVPDLAITPASYSLVFRKALPEPYAGQQLIMAGHEAMLSQWFYRPLARSDIELAARWFSEHANTKAFPQELWSHVLAQHPGEQIHLPVDIWGFPGGQTFLAGVPSLVFEGPGGIVSYLEPAMCRYFAPVIQATKARLMKEATSRDAEFGLRSAPAEVCNLILLLARYVGGGGKLTSNDTAEFLYPDLFRSIGTIGHELMCSAQTFDESLADTEYKMMERYVSQMGSGSLLCDLVDAESVGLENAIRVMKNHPESNHIGIRVDSGNIALQCVMYYRQMQANGITDRTIVFEDEVSPDTIREVYATFQRETGQPPTMLFPGAGGYWWRLVHRDTVAAAFKRTATNDQPNIKFSNSPGKESIPGRLRVYAQGERLIVADASESIDGDLLFVKLVEQGRIVYHESFQVQASRADHTWNRFTGYTHSPLVSDYIQRFRSMRDAEITASRHRLHT